MKKVLLALADEHLGREACAAIARQGWQSMWLKRLEAGTNKGQTAGGTSIVVDWQLIGLAIIGEAFYMGNPTFAVHTHGVKWVSCFADADQRRYDLKNGAVFAVSPEQLVSALDTGALNIARPSPVALLPEPAPVVAPVGVGLASPRKASASPWGTRK